MKLTGATPLVIALSLGHHLCFAQGSLTPPSGTPAPAFKTLQQLEPRTDVQKAPASAVTTNDPNYHFIITAPGSYYLSGNVAVTKPNGILINAQGVTLDLNGFEVSRSSGSGGNGVEFAGTSARIILRRGSIRGFQIGVEFTLSGSNYPYACLLRDIAVSNCSLSGIDGHYSTGLVLESCRVHDGGTGMEAGAHSIFRNCTASNCTTGIATGSGAVALSCSTFDTTSSGIVINEGCALLNCAAQSNQTSTGGAGIRVTGAGGVTLYGCSSRLNSSAGTTSSDGVGFALAQRTNIQYCTAGHNQGDGIYTVLQCLISHNLCRSNGSSGDGAGIHTLGWDSRIEANQVTDNDRGIEVGGLSPGGDLIICNTASSNGINYVIAADSRFGAIIDDTATGTAAVTGNAASSTAQTTNPWANFSY